MGTKNRFNTKQECLKMCRYKMFNPYVVPGRACPLFESFTLTFVYMYTKFISIDDLINVYEYLSDLCLLEYDQGHCSDERRGQWWFVFLLISEFSVFSDPVYAEFLSPGIISTRIRANAKRCSIMDVVGTIINSIHC